MSSFGISKARDLLNKLVEEQQDFVASGCLSARHAINAVMTAYHLYEWVWGEFAKGRYDLHKQWKILPHPSSEKFLRYLISECPAMEFAQGITNGTKHFNPNQVLTGEHHGAFQRGVFQRDAFDVSRLWVERDGQRQDAQDFVSELVDFWNQFFMTYKV